MSDGPLREPDRHLKETGTVQDEAAFLVERVRAGVLSELHLGLAAHLGHEAARQAYVVADPLDVLTALVSGAVGGFTDIANDEPDTWRAWGLGDPTEWPYGSAAAQRGAIAILRSEFDASARSYPVGWVALFEAGVDLVERRLIGVSTDSERAQDLSEQFTTRPVGVDVEDPVQGGLVWLLAPEPGLYEIAEAVGHMLVDADRARAALASELVPWALGTSDPVRERVEARQQEATGE